MGENFTLDVAKERITNLSHEVDEVRKSTERITSDVRSLSKAQAEARGALIRVETAQNEVLRLVQSIATNGGTARCEKRGVILDTVDRRLQRLEVGSEKLESSFLEKLETPDKYCPHAPTLLYMKKRHDRAIGFMYTAAVGLFIRVAYDVYSFLTSGAMKSG